MLRLSRRLLRRPRWQRQWRGFAGPEDHRLHLTRLERSSAFANVAALAALAAVVLRFFGRLRISTVRGS